MLEKPLHTNEITERIIKGGLWLSAGITPMATVSARLYSDIKKYDEQSTFVKVEPNMFSLRDTRIDAVSNIRKPKPKNLSPSVSSNTTYSFLDAAEKVLDQLGNRNSMHSREITVKAIEQGWLTTSGKTPEATMNAQLVTDLKRAKAKGEPGRFVRTSPGHFSLVKWMGTGLPYQISKHNRDIHKKVTFSFNEFKPSSI